MMSELGLRALSGFGFFALLAIAWISSSERRAVDWRAIGAGVALQLALAVTLLVTPAQQIVFDVFATFVDRLIAYADAGSRFVFGPLLDSGFSFALGALPIIVFMSSFFATLYYMGLIQPIVRLLSWMLARTLRVSGAESLTAIANVFVGLTESGVVVRPYLARMTRSEFFTFMTLGMSTVAGSVLVAYVRILGGGDFAGHLVTASLISAPAGIVVAKLMIPETGEPETLGRVPSLETEPATNLIDAAAEGGLAGLRLALNVGALLIAFVALIALANDLLGFLGGLVGLPGLEMQTIFGIVFAPVALLMGIPWAEASEVGALLGVKTVLNEFIAYQGLAESIAAGTLSERSAIIASYALCGFANFGSLAILLGGIQGLAPGRRPEAAALGLRSIFAGTLATCMTGCLAGVLL